jgi:glycosyltransferase involved in cell wall biosynthesis
VPNFSILTPVRNSEEFILSCLKSVAAQGVEVEHLIQDANSTDKTSDIIAEFSRSNIHVKSKTENDTGQSDALNKLLDRATGKYIGWLNSDETYLSKTLLQIENVFEKTGADVVYGDCFFVDSNQSLIRLYSNHRYSKSILRNLGCYIPSCATFFRVESLRKFQFDVRLKRCMDWDLYLTLSEVNFQYLKKPLSTFAVHSNQITNSPEKYESQEFELLQKKHSLQRNPSITKPEFRYKALRIFLKLSNGNYFKEIYFYFQARNSGKDFYRGY